MMMNLLQRLVPAASRAPSPMTEAAQAAKQRAEAAWRARNPNYNRAPLRPADLVLAPLTLAWADQLPTKQRPNHLLQRYPRVANRIALCWCEPALCALLFEELASNDRRPRRMGFPSEVAIELRNLHVFSKALPASSRKPAAVNGGPSRAA